MFARRLHGDWRRHLVLVRPESVVRWHRQGWRLYWRWRSRPRLGRPRLSAEVRELIATVAQENRLWGTERIRSELLKLGISASARSIHPTAAWVWRQLIEATAWGRQPSYLIHDSDRVYGADFASKAAAIGIKSLRTPVQAPNANSVGERVVRTLRRECLDHLLILGEQHLRAVLAEFAAYYNQDRPHRALGLETPVPTSRRLSGEIRSRPLHHAYERAA